MSITVLLTQMIKLFIIICVGFVLSKVKILDNHTRGQLTKILLYVTTPALIIHSFIENMGGSRAVLLKLFGVATITYLLLPLAGVILMLLLRVSKKERGMYIFMTTFANVGFMGFPVVEALFGSQGVFYTAVFNCMFNIVIFSFGVVLMYYGEEDGKSLKEVLSLKKIMNPGIIGCLCAIIIFLAGIMVPPVVDDVFASVGGLTSPLAMILVGASLAGMKAKELFGGVRIYVFTVLKQIAIPLLTWPLISIFITDELLSAVTLLMVSMPVANSAVLFATEYGKDEKLAAKGIFITTVASLVTIPLVVYICMGS